MEAAYSKARAAIAEDLADAQRRVDGLMGILAAFDRLGDGLAEASVTRRTTRAPKPARTTKPRRGESLLRARRRVAIVRPLVRPRKTATGPAPTGPTDGTLDLQERVFQALKTGPAKSRDLAATLGVEEVELRYALRLLRAAGRIGVRGATSAARWERSS